MLSSFGGSVIGFSNVAGLLGIIAYCVFAAQTAQEYTYGTLRNLLVRQPGRLRLLVGKLISMKIFAIVMVMISGVVSIAIAYFLAPGAKVSREFWFTSDGWSQIIHTYVNVSISVVGFLTAPSKFSIINIHRTPMEIELIGDRRRSPITIPSMPKPTTDIETLT